MQYVSGVFNGGNSPGTRTQGQVTLRGFAGSNVSLNGVTLPKTMPLFFDAAAIEAVDFLKGATTSLSGGQTSTLGPYGFGGSVNIISVRPIEEDRIAFTVRTEFGSGYMYRVVTDNNRAFENDKGGIRVITALELNKPFYLPGDIDRGEKLFVAPSFLWNPTDKLEINFDTSVQMQEGPSYQGIPYLQSKFITGINSFFGDKDSRQEYIGLTLQASAKLELTDASTLRFGISYIRCDLDRTAWGVNTTMKGVPSLTYYDSIVATGSAPLVYSTTDSVTEDSSANVAYIHQFDAGATYHTLALGVDWLREKNEMESTSGTTGDIDIYNPVYDLPATLTTSASETRVDRYGIFLQDQIEWKSFIFLAGARFDKHRSVKKNEGDSISPRVGITYMLTETCALYGNYSRSEAPNFGYNDADGKELTDSWKGEQYEVGVKKQLFNKALASLSCFNMRQKDRPMADPDKAGAYYLGGEIVSTGIEMTLSGNITKKWGAFVSYSYANYINANAGTNRDTTPKHSISAWQTWSFKDGLLEGLKIGLGARWVDSGYSTFMGQFISEDYKINSYVLLDLSVSYTFDIPSLGMKDVHAKLDVKNLLDEEYVESARHAADTFPGAPRSVAISFTVYF